jgi:dihydroflavonol-4-reductase
MVMNVNEYRILITGASGGLGKQLIYHLTNQGVRPIAHCRETSDTTYIDSHNLQKRFADIRNPDELDRLVDGVEGVIHTAAIVNFRQDGMPQFTAVNTAGAVDLYKAARQAGVRRFVQVSSVVAVGALPRSNQGRQRIRFEPVNEESEFNLGHLQIPYVKTKRAAETELLALARGGAPELIVVNPSIIVSPSRTGDDRSKASKMFSRLVVPDYPNIVNLVDVRDVAPAIVAALSKGRAGQRYILAGDNISAHDLVLMVSDILGKTPHLVRPPRLLVNLIAHAAPILGRLHRPHRTSIYPDLIRLADYDWAYSSRKARRELHFAPRSTQATLNDLLTNSLTGSWQKPGNQ